MPLGKGGEKKSVQKIVSIKKASQPRVLAAEKLGPVVAVDVHEAPALSLPIDVPAHAGRVLLPGAVQEEPLRVGVDHHPTGGNVPLDGLVAARLRQFGPLLLNGNGWLVAKVQLVDGVVHGGLAEGGVVQLPDLHLRGHHEEARF